MGNLDTICPKIMQTYIFGTFWNFVACWGKKGAYI